MKRLAKVISVVVIIMIMVALFAPMSVFANSTAYYVDNVGGNDSNTGTSPGTAWKTLSKVNSITFQPGDSILLKCGGSWTGQLYPKGNGVNGSPIILSSYGTGAKPIIAGGGVSSAVYLKDPSYWEISKLEVTNSLDFNTCRQGINIGVGDGAVHHHVYVTDCYIHNVDNVLDYSQDYDPFNRSAALLFERYYGSTAITKLDDVRVQNNTIEYSSQGLVTYNCIDFDLLFSNLYVANNNFNYIYNNSICLNSCDSPLVEYNVAANGSSQWNTNTCGMWPIICENAVFQYNEVYGQTNTYDGEGFDSDWNCHNSVFQYNYSHDNVGGGFLICNYGNDPSATHYNDGTIIRYNVLQNNGQCVFSFNGPSTNTKIYNNSVYIPSGNTGVVKRDVEWGGYASGISFKNNIFYNLGNTSYDNVSSAVYNYNIFYGDHPASEPSDAHKLTSDPMFVYPGNGDNGLGTVDGYKLMSGSPAINSGTVITNNGGKDYWGNSLPTGAPNRGAYNGPAISAPTFNSNVYYTIVNRQSSLSICPQYDSLLNGALINQNTLDTGWWTQQWQIQSSGDGYFNLVNRSSSKSLCPQYDSLSNGALIIQKTLHTDWWTQQWRILSCGDGYYTIVNRQSGKSICPQDDSTSIGALINQNTLHSDWWTQQWQIVQVP